MIRAAADVILFEVVPDGGEVGQLAVSAYAGGEKIGGALADFGTAPGPARLRALVVRPRHRGQGIGQRLALALERLAWQHGATRIDSLYEDTRESAPVVNHILDKSGWKRTRFSVHALRMSPGILEAPWMRTRLPAQYEVFAWAELKQADAADSGATHGAAPCSAAGLEPMQESEIEPASSIGVRCHGRVIGWMLTHRVAPDMVRYSRLFVAKAHRPRLSGVALIAEAIRRQNKAGIPKGTFAVSSGNLQMMRIVKRRIEPFIDTTTELCYASKNLERHEVSTGAHH